MIKFMIQISLLALLLTGCGGGSQPSTEPTSYQQLGGGNLIIDGVPHPVATLQPRDTGAFSTPDFVKVNPNSDRSDYLIQIPAYTMVNGVPDLTQPKILIKFYIMHYMPHMMTHLMMNKKGQVVPLEEGGYPLMPNINFNHTRPDSWNRDGTYNPNEYGQDIVYPPNKGAVVMLQKSENDDYGNPTYTGSVTDGEFFLDPTKTDDNDSTVMITFQFKTMLMNKDDH